MQGRGDYRIRSAKRTEDDIDLEFEEQFKLSSDLQSKKREQIPGHYRRPIDSNQNSRLKQSRTGSSFGGSLGSRVGRVLRVSKNEKDKNMVADIEFNNVRWISIVSAYDSKRLKHVTVSKQSCEQFLKKYGSGVKKDPTAAAYFKDVKKHFHSWLSKVNQTFVIVLNHFLASTDKSPLMQLQKVNPILEQIRYDTTMMKQKLQSCLKYYENNDFRRMYTKFTDFNSFSSRLEQIIGIIFKKKQKIDSLFFELEEGGDIDKNLQKIRKSGVKETKKLIYTDIKNTNLCDRIMEKVTFAINDMSSKGLTLFHKIQNAQLLINRIKKILSDSHKKVTIKDIKKFSQIFHEVLDETQKFQQFVQQFDSESDFVTPELREKIHFYREELMSKKRAVGEMQIIFVSTVINETIDLLHSCHSLNTALTQNHTNYSQYNHLLDAIINCMLDETKKGITQGLIKHNRIAFSRLEDELEKISNSLKRHHEGFVIDTEDGQVASMECGKLTEQYKDKIKNLIKKHEDALRQLDSPLRDLKLPSTQKDPEMIFLNNLVKISQAINNREWHKKINNQKCFHEPHSGIAISAKEIEKTESLFQEFEAMKQQIEEINNQNPLKDLIKIVRTQNGLYLQCSYIIRMLKIIDKTSERNILEVVTQVSQASLKRKKELEKKDYYKQTKAYGHLIDHLYCLILVKGLKKKAVQEIDDPKFVIFPENEYDQKQMENQRKYRSLILQRLDNEAILVQTKLKAHINIMKDMINSKLLIDKLKRNENGEFMALTKVLSAFSIQMFKLCLLNSSNEGKSTETRRIVLEIIKCLKSKSMNIDILEGQLDVQHHEAGLRVRKQFIHFKNINEDALKEFQQLSKIQANNPLDTLSNTTHIIAEYLYSTKQSVYLALNQWKQPIWIGTPDQSQRGLTEEIDLNGYPRGTFINEYTHEPARIEDQKNIKPAKPLTPSKKEPSQEMIPKSPNIIIKEKSHPKDSMDEEILALESDKQIRDEMNEDIPDVPQDEFEMGEEIGDDMDEDFEEYEEDMKQQVEKMDEQIIEDSKTKGPQQIFKQQQPHIETQKKEESKHQASTYEVIPFFRELEQIKELFNQINHSEKQFWKENIDFQEVEDYFHRPQDLKDRNNFIKSLENCFSLFLGAKFGPKLGQIVKGLDKLKAIKGIFLSLGEKNYQKIFEVLNISERNYSVLLNSKGQVVQIFSFDGDNSEFKKKRCKKCVYDYLEREFKTTFFNHETFDFEGFITTCLKVQTSELINQDQISFHYVIKYRAKCQQSLPRVDTDKILQSMILIKQKFETNLETGINLTYSCLQFWCKALDPNTEDCYKPDYSILDGYIKELNQIDHKQSICHYLTQFKEECLALRDQIKRHRNIIDNLFFKVDNSNILQCVETLTDLYKNISLNKLHYQSQGKKMTLFLSKEQSEGILNQSNLSVLILDFFDQIMIKSSITEITQQKIVEQIQKIYKEGKTSDEQFPYFMEFLNILQIQHFFIKKPHFLFKKTIEELVLGIIKQFEVTSIQQINYDEFFKNVLTVKKSNFSTEIFIKKQINHEQFSGEFIKKSKQKVENMKNELKQSTQSFKNKIKKTDMSSVLIDFLKSKMSQNNPINLILVLSTDLDNLKQVLTTKIRNKSLNLLNYILSFEKVVRGLDQQIDKKMEEMKSMKENSLLLKQKKGDLQYVNQFFTDLRQWTRTVGLSKELTSYILISANKNYTINLQFSQSTDQRSKSKEYLEILLKKHWILDLQFEKSWKFIYEKYISKQIKIEIGAGGTSCIYYNLQQSVKKIMEDIRVDVADSNVCLEFVDNFNSYRFCHSIQALQGANKNLTLIIERLQLKQQLLQIKKIMENCQFSDIKEYPMINSFLSCILDELDIKTKSLQDSLSLTKLLKVKQTPLNLIKKWYNELCHNLLNLNSFEVRSPSNVQLCLLPIAKIGKDKAKNHQIISSFLKEIKIDSDFQIKLQGQNQVVHLKPNPVKIVVGGTEKKVVKDEKFPDFEPEVPEGEMILFMIQQQDEKSTPLWISKIQLQTEVELELAEFKSTVNLHCGFWRIGVQDYQEIKDKKSSVEEEKICLQKKLRGLISPQDRIKDVKMGQQVFCPSLGQWFAGQLLKYQHRVQEQQRAEQQRLRLLQLKCRQQQAFLKQIQQELVKIHIPAMPFTNNLDDTPEISSKQPPEIQGFFKKILMKYTKIIEKLEENKPTEELSRLEFVKKNYLKQLEDILAYNYQLEKKIVKEAELKFQKILGKRKEAKQEKQKRKEEKKKRTEEKLAAKKQAENLQLNNQNTLNVAASTQGPLPEAPKVIESEIDASEASENRKDFDVIDLLLQRKDTSDAIETFLIGWLQTNQPKDSDFYRCIIDEFYCLDKKDIRSLTELK